MKIAGVFSHRNGLDILQSPRFAKSYNEFVSVLGGLPAYLAKGTKKTSAAHVISPGAIKIETH